MKLPVQIIHSECLREYSTNPKLNHILRTLIAFNGYNTLFMNIQNYINSEEGAALTDKETWELYTAAKWAQYFGSK